MALAFYCAAIVLAGFGWWFLRRVDDRLAWVGMAALASAIIMLPVYFPGKDTGTKAAVLLCCVFPLKLWDAWLDRDSWRRAHLLDWLTFLANPVALVHRCHIALSKPILVQNLSGLARGLAEVTLGVILFRYLARHAPAHFPFWIDHGLRLLASYLCIWDGGCVLFTAVWRLLGFRCVEFSFHPILARTPAEFWRRYNHWIGQFLYEDLFRVVRCRRNPAVGVFTCFLAMGVLHEFLAWDLTGRVTWHLPAFFLLHAIATAATFRLRPTGLGAVLGLAGTLTFHYFTSVLFFVRFGEVVGGWYPAY